MHTPGSSRLHRVGELEIDQDLNHERVEWRVERAAWLLALLILVAAAIGLLGGGPLSSRNVTAADQSIRVRYEWIARAQAPVEFVIECSDRSSDQIGADQIAIDREFAESIRVDSAVPRFREIVVEGDLAIISFGQPLGSQTIRMRFEHHAMGRKTAQVRWGNSQPVSMTCWILP